MKAAGWVLIGVLLATRAAASPPILVVDLSEAYTRSTALATLLADVDRQLKALADQHRPERERLKAQLRELKAQGSSTRDQQLVIARKISEIEATAEQAEDRLTLANQEAIAKVDAAISQVKADLLTESGARALLDVQETLYLRPDCACIATDRLYEQLNQRLPKVELAVQTR